MMEKALHTKEKGLELHTKEMGLELHTKEMGLELHKKGKEQRRRRQVCPFLSWVCQD